jgi:hypothetical protein
MAINYDVLKQELTGTISPPSPLAEEYPPLVEIGDHEGLATILNRKSGAGADTVNLDLMSRSEFLLAITPAYLVLPTLSDELQKKWDRIITVITGAESIHLNDPRIQGIIGVAVADGVLTTQQVSSIGKRTGSRAEVLFGVDTSVTVSDVSTALKE